MDGGAEAFLRSETGCILVLSDDEETWIGRDSFQVPRHLQLQCSRRQARVFHQYGSFYLQCYGTNPLFFVLCQSVNFRLKDSGNLYSVRKGEVVKLTSGDQFYFIRTECLLTFLCEPLIQEASSVPCGISTCSGEGLEVTGDDAQVLEGSGVQTEPVDVMAAASEAHADAETLSQPGEVRKVGVEDVPDSLEDQELELLRNSEHERINISSQEQETSLGIETGCSERASAVITIESSEDDGIPLPPVQTSSSHLHGPLPNMEDVIVTVTGYIGNDRAKLVSLINRCGAVYSGDLLNSHTHLVCWKFSGKKYHLAKKWGMLIINHQWFEHSLEAGRRLPEEPFTLKCGQAVGPVKYDAELQEDGRTEARRFRGKERNGESRSSTEFLGTQTSYLKELDAVLQEAGSSARRVLRGKGKGKGKENEDPRLQTRDSSSEQLDDGKANKRLLHGKEKINEDGEQRNLQSGVKLMRTQSSYPQELQNNNETRGNRAQLSGRTTREVSDGAEQRDTYKSLLRRKCKRKISTGGASLASALRLKQQKVDAYLQVRARAEPAVPEKDTPDSTISDHLQGPLPDIDEGMCESSKEVVCVICHAEERSPSQGVLACGHSFCYECIRKWARQNESKGAVCPLCKAGFDFITRKDVVTSLQRSDVEQFSERIVMVKKPKPAEPQQRLCMICQGVDTDELLVECSWCRGRAVHTFCLDPPWDARYPWQCSVCLAQSVYR